MRKVNVYNQKTVHVEQDGRVKVVRMGGQGAPSAITGASYITRVAESGLSNEFALASLDAGLLATDGDGNLSIADASDIPSHTHNADDITAGTLNVLRIPNLPISQITNLQAALDALQPLDSDLTAIAALAPSDGDFIARVSGAWLNRTPTQAKTLLAISTGDVSGLGTIATQNANNVSISGGSISSTPISGSTGSFTTVAASSTVTIADGSAGTPAINFTNDVNMGFYRVGSGEIGISVASNVRVRINTTGLGVNIQPAVALHVSSGSATTFRLATTAAQDVNIHIIRTGTGEWALGRRNSDGSFRIANNASIGTNDHLVILQTSGNTGLGTPTPSSKLDVVGDVEIGDANAFYMGDPTTNNTWRLVRSGNDLVIQRREGGVYVTKSTIAA